jgi:hypothetical protein
MSSGLPLGVRPTSSRMREAIFTYYRRPSGALFWDLFCGSGPWPRALSCGPLSASSWIRAGQPSRGSQFLRRGAPLSAELIR